MNYFFGTPCYFNSLVTDIDECSEGPDACHIYANCTDTPGSYSCTCNPGYQGNGSICDGEH